MHWLPRKKRSGGGGGRVGAAGERWLERVLRVVLPGGSEPVSFTTLSPFLTGRMFLREPSWKYSAKLAGS